MIQEGNFYLISKLDNTYAKSIIKELKHVGNIDNLSVWEINQESNLYLCRLSKEKICNYYLARFEVWRSL